MPVVRDREIGVFYWASADVPATVGAIRSLGVRVCQLGFVGELPLTRHLAAEYRVVLEGADVQCVTVIAAYTGEDYADIPTVQRTVGFVPRTTRTAREIRTRQVIDFGAAMGVKNFACHVGYVPEDRLDPDYDDVRDVVRRICDYAAGAGMTFCLETGQEPAELLLRFFEDVGRRNLRINFDPANMVLYGSGEPIGAFRLLAPHVASVHGKDGDWPDAAKPGSLGTERPLGQGAVDIPRFMRTLKELGYPGTIHVESGLHGDEPRLVTLQKAVNLLNELRG